MLIILLVLCLPPTFLYKDGQCETSYLPIHLSYKYEEDNHTTDARNLALLQSAIATDITL